MVERTHKHGMKVLIDIIPNHVARNYEGKSTPSDAEAFGATDDKSVEYARNNEGRLKLLFYVHDQMNQYPEQRSKGFLWFLSFYLRMAAWDKREPDHSRLVLIDEPGSYLHAKAQRDILSVLNARAKEKNQTIIYTTHSPYLLPASDIPYVNTVLCAIIVVSPALLPSTLRFQVGACTHAS